MYDLKGKFSTFYSKHVVLPDEKQKELHRLKNINLGKLKEGLAAYNAENGTTYKIIDSVVQGSMNMHTVTQNDKKDYDIDAGIIFEKSNLTDKNDEALGTTKVKNIVVDSLKRKVKNFKKDPEAKTNCVRIEYVEGYHIDFAIYRKCFDGYGQVYYEHGGSQWRARNPWAINNWFDEVNDNSDDKIRKVVRLLKMFCKSRKHWNMPGGLIQTVLVEECLVASDRLDEMFYYTLEAIRNRLEWNQEVSNPTDNTLSLLLKEGDKTKVSNLHKRLVKYLGELSILFEDECTKEEALSAWTTFFEHSYWYKQLDDHNKTVARTNEQFVGDVFAMDLKYDLDLECNVSQNGFQTDFLSNIIKKGKLLQTKKTLDFFVNPRDIPKPYNVYWKVRNKGAIAKQKNMLRGEIVKTNKVQHREVTSFKGEHFVECYIVKDDVCVAKAKIEVPIDTILSKKKKMYK